MWVEGTFTLDGASSFSCDFLFSVNSRDEVFLIIGLKVTPRGLNETRPLGRDKASGPSASSSSLRMADARGLGNCAPRTFYPTMRRLTFFVSSRITSEYLDENICKVRVFVLSLAFLACYRTWFRFPLKFKFRRYLRRLIRLSKLKWLYSFFLNMYDILKKNSSKFKNTLFINFRVTRTFFWMYHQLLWKRFIHKKNLMRSSSRVTNLDLLASMLSIIIQSSAISVRVSTRNDDVPGTRIDPSTAICYARLLRSSRELCHAVY